MKITATFIRYSFFAAALFSGKGIQAQQWRIGPLVSYGLGEPFFNKQSIINEEGSVAHRSAVNHIYAFGGMVEYSGNNRWFVESGILYGREQKLISIKVDEFLLASEAFNLDLIKVPLRGGYIFGRPGQKFRPLVYGGPSFSFLLNESRKRNDYRFGPDEIDPLYDIRLGSHKFFTASLQLGLGCRYMLNTRSDLQLGVDYQTVFINRNKRREGINNVNSAVNMVLTYKYVLERATPSVGK